uniref:RING-type domain-containing protein n=2 Tax=Meloidogyne TaxID=189290 RepID=A0A6V7XCP0_MELEN|nr:unnamed protein product [Meloidogyne enterolobii]CAD2197096.1 unnamed protein product [Meloidogyne enterolobii]
MNPPQPIFICDFTRLIKEHNEFKSELANLRNVASWQYYDMEILRKRVRDLEMKYESGNSNTWSIPQREFLQARRSRRAEVPGNRESDEASGRLLRARNQSSNHQGTHPAGIVYAFGDSAPEVVPPLQPVQTQDLPPINSNLVEMQPIQVPFEEEMVQLVPELSGGHVPVFHQDGSFRMIRAYTAPECIGCLVAQPQIVYNCGHLVFCLECKRRAGEEWNSRCPICKKIGPAFEAVHIVRGRRM